MGATTPLQYHGGPFLQTFEIYPLYYGNWGASEITTQQAYVVNLAAYMSGEGAPAGEQPMMKQYGVNQVTVAAAATANPHATPVVLTRSAGPRYHSRQPNQRKTPGFRP